MCPGDGALTTTSVLAATGGLDHSSIASYNRHGLREKLSGGSAKSEVPDTVAPTHSTASRGQFATLGESSRYFNHPKTSNTHKAKIRATLALVVLISRRTALRAVPRLRCERLPSRPGKFHPEPLTDPDLILSHHPARAID